LIDVDITHCHHMKNDLLFYTIFFAVFNNESNEERKFPNDPDGANYRTTKGVTNNGDNVTVGIIIAYTDTALHTT